MKVAFFDFDGTITTHDSLIKFIRFAVGEMKFTLGMIWLIPMFALYKLRVIPNYKAKQYLLSYFFKGMDENKFIQITEKYSLNKIKTILRTRAMKKIEWHKAQGHKVVIVSASIEHWLKPWCDEHNLDLIATEMEIKNGIVTGKFVTKNCYGTEKERRIREKYNLNKFDYIYSYGDSKGDKELLALANEGYYKPFRV